MLYLSLCVMTFDASRSITWLRGRGLGNIRQSSTKYDHLLSALPTDICSSINDSLAEIDENAEDAY
jgi:hypothetical protein